jgi:hypothetical protein
VTPASGEPSMPSWTTPVTVNVGPAGAGVGLGAGVGVGVGDGAGAGVGSGAGDGDGAAGLEPQAAQRPHAINAARMRRIYGTLRKHVAIAARPALVREWACIDRSVAEAPLATVAAKQQHSRPVSSPKRPRYGRALKFTKVTTPGFASRMCYSAHAALVSWRLSRSSCPA